MTFSLRRAGRIGRAGTGLSLTAWLLGGCLTLNLTEDGIYVPQEAPALTAPALAEQASNYVLEPQRVIAGDGARLTGVFLKRPGADRTLLYFGGNMFTVGNSGPRLAKRLESLGVNMMMVDFRGYGASALAEPDATRLFNDALAVFDHLATLLDMSSSPIVGLFEFRSSLLRAYALQQSAIAGGTTHSGQT
jgi:hypothetical protein